MRFAEATVRGKRPRQGPYNRMSDGITGPWRLISVTLPFYESLNSTRKVYRGYVCYEDPSPCADGYTYVVRAHTPATPAFSAFKMLLNVVLVSVLLLFPCRHCVVLVKHLPSSVAFLFVVELACNLPHLHLPPLRFPSQSQLNTLIGRSRTHIQSV